jgi:hypothetical protein
MRFEQRRPESLAWLERSHVAAPRALTVPAGGAIAVPVMVTLGPSPSGLLLLRMTLESATWALRLRTDALGQGLVRDVVRDAVDAITLPALPGGIESEEALALGITVAGGQPAPARISSKFEVVLFPDENDMTLTSTVVWRRVDDEDDELVHPVKLAIME